MPPPKSEKLTSSPAPLVVKTVKIENDGDLTRTCTQVDQQKSKDQCNASDSPTVEPASNPNIQLSVGIGPIETTVDYDTLTETVAISAKLTIPFITVIELAKVTGNIKQGVSVGFNYNSTAQGKVGVRLDDAKHDIPSQGAVLYWDFFAFGSRYKDKVMLFDVVKQANMSVSKLRLRVTKQAAPRF